MLSTLQIITAVVWVIIGLKLMFISSTLLHKYVNYNNESMFYKYDDKLVYVRKVTEFSFISLMCLLMIFIFHPRKQNMGYMTKEIKFLMYMFAWIIIISADWSDFFNQKIKNSIK